MRQRRWLEFLKECNFDLSYHHSLANQVADVLSSKSLHMSALMVIEFDLVEQFQDLSLVYKITLISVKLVILKLTSIFLDEIRESQKLDFQLLDRLVLVNQGKQVDFRVDENEILNFWDKVCVPDMSKLKKMILEESHKISLSIHPRAIEMYQDLKKIFWCPGMKKDVA